MLDKHLLKERLRQLFENETQDDVAARINTTQGNVSKWLRQDNSQAPTLDMLYSIASEYNVSVDWLLGFSEEPEIDGVDLDKLTYEKVARILDRLLEYGNLELLNLSSIRSTDQTQNQSSEEEEEDEEATSGSGNKENPPDYRSDYLVIKDGALSHMFRRRFALKALGTDMLGMWKETNVPKYAGIGLLNIRGKAQLIIDTKKWATFNSDADWVDVLKMINDMTEEERDAYLKNRKKEGNDNG